MSLFGVGLSLRFEHPLCTMRSDLCRIIRDKFVHDWCARNTKKASVARDGFVELNLHVTLFHHFTMCVECKII